MSAAAHPMAMLGAFREAADLAQEALTKVRDAWARLVDAVRDLTLRARQLLDGGVVWSGLPRQFPEEIDRAIGALDGLVARIGPLVGAVAEALTGAVGNAVPVLTLFDTAITYGHDIVHQISGVAADLVAGGDRDEWEGPARRNYEARVREQIGAAESVAAEVEAIARWLSEIGAHNTAYLTNLGHLGADLTSRFVAATVEAGAAAGSDAPRFAASLGRLADAADNAVGRIAGWARDLQNGLTSRTLAGGLDSWPSAATF